MSDCFCDLWNVIKGLSISNIADILVAITSVFALWLAIKSYIRENENRKRDTEQQQWNALYPHRLKFYAEFYDNLFKLLNCNKNRTSTSICKDLKNYCVIFNKFTEDSKVLFDEEIQNSVSVVYDLLFKFLNNNNIHIEGQARAVKNLWENQNDGFNDKLNNLLQEIKNAKLDTDLREKFMKVLKLEGNKDE